MLQKEVVDRMVAAPATADYGRLSVMLQWRYAMENVLVVPPQRVRPAAQGGQRRGASAHGRLRRWR